MFSRMRRRSIVTDARTASLRSILSERANSLREKSRSWLVRAAPRPTCSSSSTTVASWLPGSSRRTLSSGCEREHGLHDVVEVVGDPPGDAADGLDLLRLAELLLEQPALGEVLDRALVVDRAAGGIAHGARVLANEDLRAVRTDPGVLEADHRTVPLDRLEESPPVVDASP
ncbi:MAG: hypothetical protein AB2L07_03740 [Thermoanaerobaculaceae bacterium]